MGIADDEKSRGRAVWVARSTEVRDDALPWIDSQSFPGMLLLTCRCHQFEFCWEDNTASCLEGGRARKHLSGVGGVAR